MEKTKTNSVKNKKKHTVFVQGPISPQFIADSISKHSVKHQIGAHSIFLGQVRRDSVQNSTVRAIEYTAFTELAEEKIGEIREKAFAQYNLECMHIYHSLGEVKCGEICLFVFTSSVHREAATKACHEIVESIKKEVPIWGKELHDNNSHSWKVNL
ncbi:MAG TPA: molybdenum cofactor biosynthesis protein MoaE [Bacteroidia bacterium]|nr:molybdenum cofactor biosynthesis protein MoaE [Bacteroidia bacterium]